VALAINKSACIIPFFHNLRIAEICALSPTLTDMTIIRGAIPPSDIADQISNVVFPTRLGDHATLQEAEDHFTNGYYEAAVSTAFRLLQSKLKKFASEKLPMRYFKKRPLGSYTKISLVNLFLGKGMLSLPRRDGAHVDRERMATFLAESFKWERFYCVTARWVINEVLKLIRLNKMD